MNTNDSKPPRNSKGTSNNSNGKKPIEPTPPQTPPLSSPEEPTRAYPTDPSRTYSSDPSQYSSPPGRTPPVEPAGPSKIYTTEPLDTARIESEEVRGSSEQARKERPFEEKRQTTNSAGGPEKRGDFYSYATSNKEQTITYILLILGLLILLFINALFGGLMLGMVAGYYFSSEIIHYIRNIGQVVEGPDQPRYIVLAALLLGLLILAPGIFIGAIIIATFKQVMAGPKT